jgi:hypothetical protein
MSFWLPTALMNLSEATFVGGQHEPVAHRR